MKTLFFSILTLTFVSLSQPSFASADCKVCVEAQAINQKIKVKSSGAFEEAEKWLEVLKLSSNPEVKAQEVQAIARLAAFAIPQDSNHVFTEYFYDLYLEEKTAFDKVIRTLPADDQKILRDSIHRTEKMNKEGNG